MPPVQSALLVRSPFLLDRTLQEVTICLPVQSYPTLLFFTNLDWPHVAQRPSTCFQLGSLIRRCLAGASLVPPHTSNQVSQWFSEGCISTRTPPHNNDSIKGFHNPRNILVLQVSRTSLGRSNTTATSSVCVEARKIKDQSNEPDTFRIGK